MAVTSLAWHFLPLLLAEKGFRGLMKVKEKESSADDIKTLLFLYITIGRPRWLYGKERALQIDVTKGIFIES